MSRIPENLRYTDDHEWVAVDDRVAMVGITDHAQDQLGDLVYLGDFPKPGEEVQQGDVIGVIESVKATADIYAPVSGKIAAVNEDLLEEPGEINSDPYGDNWILQIKMTEASELEELLDAEAYELLVEE
ncbi:MAG: glycine cleavage system protein GcvH [Myxococcota bacterium]|nr:glycine cleavage system protein GcvH [Myxococcota bacterium]